MDEAGVGEAVSKATGKTAEMSMGQAVGETTGEATMAEATGAHVRNTPGVPCTTRVRCSCSNWAHLSMTTVPPGNAPALVSLGPEVGDRAAAPVPFRCRMNVAKRQVHVCRGLGLAQIYEQP